MLLEGYGPCRPSKTSRSASRRSTRSSTPRRASSASTPGGSCPRRSGGSGDEVTNELYLSQIEIGTPVCRTLADVRAELVRLRRAVIAAAGRDGSRIAAAGHAPVLALGGPGADAQAALLRDRRRLPAARPRADHLRLPRPRRHRRPRGGHRGDEPGPALARRRCWPSRRTRRSGSASTPASPATAPSCSRGSR